MLLNRNIGEAQLIKAERICKGERLLLGVYLPLYKLKLLLTLTFYGAHLVLFPIRRFCLRRTLFRLTKCKKGALKAP
jgi:hypothetical protein